MQEFRVLSVSHSEGVRFRALTDPAAIDAVMSRMTAMSEAGPARPGLIRMRARDLRLPEIVSPEEFARIEIAAEVGDAGVAGRLHAELGDPEYTVLFAPPRLWRWQSRSGFSSMCIDENGCLVGTLSTPDALLSVLAALEANREIAVTGAVDELVRAGRECVIVEGLHDPTVADVAPLGAETDPENEPGLVFPADARIEGVTSIPGLIFGPGLEADAAREVSAFCYWPADGYAEGAVAIPVDLGDEWATYKAVRRRVRRPGDKF